MKTPLKVFLITLVFGIASFLVGPVLWPMSTSWPAPVGAQLPLLIVVSVIESIAFGLGIAFLILGWKPLKQVTKGARFAPWAIYIGALWLLISWWPHDSLHRMIDHGDYWSLIGIEYAFHVTLIIAGAAIAYGFFDVMRWCSQCTTETR